MKKKIRWSLAMIFLSLFIFGCALFSGIPMEPVPATQNPPTESVAEPPETTADLLPTPMPIGVLTQYEGTVSLFDRDGYTLVQVNTPGAYYADESNLHVLSAYQEGFDTLPILYFSFEQNSSLLLSNQGQITTLLSVPNFSGMVGAPAKPILAYTKVEYAGETLTSHVYATTVQNLPAAAPVFTESDEQGWGIAALAVDVEAEQPVGVWYSKRPWGIGGDIVFDPRRTLSYLDLRSGANAEYLGTDENPSALSEDRQWVAYTNDTMVGTGAGMMQARNLQTGAHISYPLLTAADQRGAGEAAFSPKNQYLAWMEASGWLMAETPNFHSTVRVGNLNGNIIAEFAETAFVGVSGFGVVNRVEPVGWFDDQTLVVMARGEVWDDVALITVNLNTQVKSKIAQGNFVGFVYR